MILFEVSNEVMDK